MKASTLTSNACGTIVSNSRSSKARNSSTPRGRSAKNNRKSSSLRMESTNPQALLAPEWRPERTLHHGHRKKTPLMHHAEASTLQTTPNTRGVAQGQHLLAPASRGRARDMHSSMQAVRTAPTRRPHAHARASQHATNTAEAMSANELRVITSHNPACQTPCRVQNLKSHGTPWKGMV